MLALTSVARPAFRLCCQIAYQLRDTGHVGSYLRYSFPDLVAVAVIAEAAMSGLFALSAWRLFFRDPALQSSS